MSCWVASRSTPSLFACLLILPMLEPFSGNAYAHVAPVTHEPSYEEVTDELTLDWEGFKFELEISEHDDSIHDQAELWTPFLHKVRKGLHTVLLILPESAVAKLRNSTHFRIIDSSDCGIELPDGSIAKAWFRPLWVEGERKGYMGLCASVHDTYTQRWMSRVMIHQLAHAWHWAHIEDGYDNEETKDRYEEALETFDNTNDDGESYHWTTNEQEFFAEFTQAYWLNNADPPRTREEMMWRFNWFLMSMWGEDTTSASEYVQPAF